MENPCLTFVISSILECDEFLVIDVIHEVAHSWFGNAVTNATWEEMWLSEGLATYAQRRITTETYGTACGQPRGRGREVRALLWTHTGWYHRAVPGTVEDLTANPASRAQAPAVACPGRWPWVSSTRLRAGTASHLLCAQACPLSSRLPCLCDHPGAAFTCLETAFRLDALHRQMKLLGEDSPVSKLQVKLEPGTHSLQALLQALLMSPHSLLSRPMLALFPPWLSPCKCQAR